jgi:hypothetical protein
MLYSNIKILYSISNVMCCNALLHWGMRKNFYTQKLHIHRVKFKTKTIRILCVVFKHSATMTSSETKSSSFEFRLISRSDKYSAATQFSQLHNFSFVFRRKRSKVKVNHQTD